MRDRSLILRLTALVLTLVLSLTVPLDALAAAKYAVVNTSALILRERDSKKSKALRTLSKGEKLPILGSDGDWYRVSYGKITGYVMKAYCETTTDSGSSDSSTAGTKTTSNKTSSSSSTLAAKMKALGSAPSATAKGDTGSDVRKLQQALKIYGYYDGKIDGDFGSSTFRAVKTFQKAAGLKQTGTANRTTIEKMWSAASPSSKPSASKSAKSVADQIKALGSAPAASSRGDSGSKVKKLQQALKIMGCYTGSIDGAYGSGTVEAVKTFQKAKGLKQTGSANKTTIAKLWGDTSSGGTTASATERLNWFKNGASKIPKGATFTVKDCKTGKTFKVKRWSGANHLDAEPLTKDDTKTIKNIYGGFSWKRRAILVKYNGHVYAASMNFYPHGTQTLKNNNFDGHFCIHFYGSKTHGTKKVDAEHQNQVSIAMKYTW